MYCFVADFRQAVRPPILEVKEAVTKFVKTALESNDASVRKIEKYNGKTGKPSQPQSGTVFSDDHINTFMHVHFIHFSITFFKC